MLKATEKFAWVTCGTDLDDLGRNELPAKIKNACCWAKPETHMANAKHVDERKGDAHSSGKIDQPPNTRSKTPSLKTNKDEEEP